ncbi:hypothetical protein [Streptomyces sp. NPDC054958]
MADTVRDQSGRAARHLSSGAATWQKRDRREKDPPVRARGISLVFLGCWSLSA